MHYEKWGSLPLNFLKKRADRHSETLQAHSAFALALKYNHQDAGLCTSFALVCMILGRIDAAVVALHEVTHLHPWLQH